MGDDGSEHPRDVFWLAALALFGSVAASGDDMELSKLITSMLEPFADHVVVFGTGAAVLGVGHHWLGLLAAGRREFGAAVDHFAEATARGDDMNAPYWTADAMIETAAALASISESRDARRRSSLLATARAIAEPGSYGRLLAKLDAAG